MPNVDRDISGFVSINEDNIFGELNIAKSGYANTLNTIETKFLSADSDFSEEQILLETPTSARNANEPVLSTDLSLEFVSNNVQAERITAIQLNKSRQNEIREFVTDISNIAFEPGDDVSLSFANYGKVNQLYRVLSVEEVLQTIDDGNGTSSVSYTHLTLPTNREV